MDGRLLLVTIPTLRDVGHWYRWSHMDNTICIRSSHVSILAYAAHQVGYNIRPPMLTQCDQLYQETGH